MNYKGVFRIIGSYLFFLTVLLLVGFAVSGYFQYLGTTIIQSQNHPTRAFAETSVVCFFSAILLLSMTKRANTALVLREGILSVILIWFITIFFCALPMYFSGALDHFIDALFEVVSGITTTGASILYPKAYDASGGEMAIHKVVTGYQAIEYTFYGTVAPIIDLETNKVLLSGIEAFPKALLFWRSLVQWVGGLGVVLLFVALLPVLGYKGRVLFRY